MRSTSIFIACVGVVGVIACGGSITSVDGNDTTNTLTPADQNQLCTDTYNYVRNAVSSGEIAKLECGFGGATLADGGTGDCQQTYDTCVANASTNTIPLPATPDCTAFDQAVASCNTTVATYTKCLQEEVDAMKSLESQFPLCTQAEEESASLAAYSKLTVDCIQLMQTCTITFAPGGGSSSSGGNGDGG